ncbi:hypothetical protein BKA70DRAFT_1234370 [Coprinopsis sp. MPI-PUGE-AT-0042]|nr:hypothetical protein BKA70DRAFT_1234370 [Coprinopsis sp. MPI-PUGE-AT-0042]
MSIQFAISDERPVEDRVTYRGPGHHPRTLHAPHTAIHLWVGKRSECVRDKPWAMTSDDLALPAISGEFSEILHLGTNTREIVPNSREQRTPFSLGVKGRVLIADAKDPKTPHSWGNVRLWELNEDFKALKAIRPQELPSLRCLLRGANGRATVMGIKGKRCGSRRLLASFTSVAVKSRNAQRRHLLRGISCTKYALFSRICLYVVPIQS